MSLKFVDSIYVGSFPGSSSGTDARIDALEQEVETLEAASDAKDIVATKYDLDNYSTSSLSSGDIVKVLADETHEDAQTYYKWNGSSFTYIGALDATYTKTEMDTILSNVQFRGNVIEVSETTYSAPITVANDNTILDCKNALENLEITTSGSISSYRKDYVLQLNFTSGATATNFTDSSSVPMKWFGDSVNNTGFHAEANKHYVIMVYNDGIALRAMVQAADL